MATSIAVSPEARQALLRVQALLVVQLGHFPTVSETIAWLCDRELTRETT